MKELAAQTFGIGGPAAVLVQLMLIAVVAWMLELIAQASNKGKIASFIRTATIFVCISMVIGVVWKAISSVAGIAGL